MDKRIAALTCVLAASAPPPASAQAQPPAPEPRPFEAGRPLGVVNGGEYTPISENVTVYGAIVNAESCAYDATRKLIVAVNRGAEQSVIENDAFVSLINPDGSVHTPKWIGAARDGLVLNHPFGSVSLPALPRSRLVPAPPSRVSSPKRRSSPPPPARRSAPACRTVR